ncbi:hypothetical protein H8E88_34605 [candidate division KSB1 bacterium]|nr:hypothetical protein [candidate division KSB1 bacterium]
MGAEILITGSLAWLIIWSFLGMLAGKQHPEWLEKVNKISEEGDLGKFWSTYDSFMIQKTGHAHANSFAVVTFLIGLAMKVDLIGYSPQFQTILAIWFFIGVILAGFGDRLRNVPLAAAGGILFLTALIASFIGLFV